MSGDDLSFEQIYREHQPKIHRYLTRLAGASEADDLTQDVFLKAGQALGSFDGRASIATWLYRIATNAATDRLRSPALRRETVMAGGPDAPGFSRACADRPPSPEEQAVRREMNECIQAYVGLLPDNYRTVLVLSELEGLRDSEIAAVLGVSTGTVKIRLHRAREKLREALAANCLFYRTDCNQLACEPKEPVNKSIKPLPPRKR